MKDFAPFSANVMSVIKYTTSIANITHTRTIKNYELDFYISGNRKMTINGESFAIGGGSLVFRRPGDYAISIGGYNCYCLTLDFSMKKQHLYKNYDRNTTKEDFQEISDNKLLQLIPSHLATKHTADYTKIFDEIFCKHQSVDGKEACDILLNQLFCLILSEVYGRKLSKNTKENHILNVTCKYIQENFHNPISIKQLASNVSLSPSYFIKMFKKVANVTPTEYLISIRISNAKQLLSESNLSVAQIAEMCGFNDASYFSYYFKKTFGITPREYKENIK